MTNTSQTGTALAVNTTQLQTLESSNSFLIWTDSNEKDCKIGVTSVKLKVFSRTPVYLAKQGNSTLTLVQKKAASGPD